MEEIENSTPFGFPSHIPPPVLPGSSVSTRMSEGCFDSSFGRDTTDAGSPMTLHPAQPFVAFPELAPQGTTIPLSTFAFSSLYSSAMNTSYKGIESFPKWCGSYSAGTSFSRPISCPTNAIGRGQSFSQDVGSEYAPQSILHRGLDMHATGTNMPVRLSSSPNNFSCTNHTQTGSYFSQSNSSAMTNPTGTSVLWGSGVCPYNSQGYSGDQTLANRIANSLSKYRSVPIKRKSGADVGSPMKVYLSEKKMAARMENLTINDSKHPLPLTMKEVEDRLSVSDDDEDGDVVDKDNRIKLAKDLNEKLKKQAKDEILPKSILENIASLSYKPRMEIVLWKPPGGLLPDLMKPSVGAESTEESTSERTQTQSADMSMDASDEVLPDSNASSETIWVMPDTLVRPTGVAPPAGLAQPLGFGQPADINSAAIDARAVLAGVQPESMVAINLLAMPSVGVAQAVPFMTDPLAANMNAAAPAALPNPPVAPVAVRHQFLEDNNNVISQQDLFDALDDDMDL